MPMPMPSSTFARSPMRSSCSPIPKSGERTTPGEVAVARAPARRPRRTSGCASPESISAAYSASRSPDVDGRCCRIHRKPKPLRPHRSACAAAVELPRPGGPVVQVAHVVAPSHAAQDRVVVMRFEDATVLVVADGSGGMSGGAEAAEDALREILKAARTNGLLEQASWISVLADADDQLSRRTGQRAVVAAALIGDRIVGASAGDCGAWLVGVN